MQKQSNSIRIKRKTIFYFAVTLIALVGVTPVLADYIGPNRTVTETVSVCKIFLEECQFVTAKDDWRYKADSSWSCSNEAKPWQAYSSTPRACNSGNNGYQYWERQDVDNQVTNTYPPATINGSLQNCTLQNNWCATTPQLSLSAIEPVSGYSIIGIEGTLNGQNFACMNSSCAIPLNQGNNSFTYWALSSFGDSSTMGTLTANVDSVLPTITGAFTGIAGSNGWYLGPVSFNGSAADATSGVASFTCTLDSVALGSCNSIPVSGEGLHTLVLTARDKAGLTRILTQNASIDTQPPALNASIGGTLGANTWYTTATLNASVSDPLPGSGLSVFDYNFDNGNWSAFPSSGMLPLTEGKHNVNLRALDKAGHTVSSTKSFWLDTAAPSITTDASEPMGMNNWYSTPPAITASAHDDTSGIDFLEYSLDNGSWETYTAPLTLTDGTHRLSFWAQDEAGLVRQVDHTYQVDTRPPQIAGSLSGIVGINGWYTSAVILSASASDPMLGSGLDTFTYTLDGGGEIPYTEQLILSNGQHTVQLKAQDRAGLSYSIEQTTRVDTIAPSLKIESVLPNWVKNEITFNGIAGDNGSGISTVEVSIDGGQTWQAAKGTDSWSYIWDTLDSPNGIYQVKVRTTDLAGLMTQKTFNIGVDNHAPEINLPDSWFQWDTVTLDIWDDDSGVSETSVEISDQEGRWPKRVIQLEPKLFPLGFKWDRRLGDNTIAEAGTYDVKVSAVDNLGNKAERNASIRVLIDILPAGPTATLQPTHEAATLTPTYSATSISTAFVSTTPVSTTLVSPTPTAPTSVLLTPISSLPAALPTATHRTNQTAVVSVFGAIEPTAQVTPIPAIIVTPRTTPTQTNALDWLESVFVPGTNEESITKIESADESKTSSSHTETDNSVLWGTAATAAIGAAIAYAEEERRKKEEEEARQAALEAAEEERRKKAKARHMAKMEEKRVQEKAWEAAREIARLEQLQQADTSTHSLPVIDENAARLEEKKEARSIDLQMAIQGQAEKEKQRQEELSQALAAHYFFAQPAKTTPSVPVNKKTWWQKSIDWIDNHQTEIALGIGVVAGVGAIVLSGGLAAPLVAAAWTAGAAATAIGVAAVGTVALNNYYGRDWNENLLRNVAVAGGAATVVTGGWFLLQSATTGIGAYCAVHTTTCSHIEPVLNTVDTIEETWLSAKLGYQSWRHDPAAADTALELAMEHLDGGMPGNSVAKELDKELVELSDDALHLIEQHGDDIIPLLLKYQDDAVDIVNAYGDDGLAILQKYGDDAIDLVKTYGTPAVKVLQSVGPEAGETLLKTLDEDVLDYAIEQGPDAIEALSLWSANDLEVHGVELALRSKKDAKVLSDVKKLIAAGPIDPKHLTEQQRALIDANAANSTQYADGGQVVLGKWVDISNGFVETANDTGSIHYNPHPEMWNLLGGLGKENRGEAAWLINQQVVQTGINKGLPFEYTLNGVPAKVIENEHNAIEAIFAGKSDTEILEALDVKVMPIRMKELEELKQAGYDLVFDEVNNSYILTMP